MYNAVGIHKFKKMSMAFPYVRTRKGVVEWDYQFHWGQHL